MDLYEVRMTSFAENAVREIGLYIAASLQSPQAAIDTIGIIRAGIESLAQLPYRFSLISDEPWHSEGVRALPVKNFIILYWIDEEKKIVQIIHALYKKRDMISQLTQMRTHCIRN